MDLAPLPTPEEIETWPTVWRIPHAPGPEFFRRKPESVWEWGDKSDGYTAILDRDTISWNWHGPKDFGNTVEQSVLDFIAFGPEESTVPEGMPLEILLQIRALDFARWPKLLAEARALELKLTPPEARYSADDAARKEVLSLS